MIRIFECKPCLALFRARMDVCPICSKKGIRHILPAKLEKMLNKMRRVK